MNRFFRKEKGEIATVLTLITVGLMGIGVAVGSYLAQTTTRLQSSATECAKITNVTQTPDSELEPGVPFTCTVTLESAIHTNSISCGWSKNGDWPQTGNRWENPTCSGVNCSFGIAAPSEVDKDAVYELVGFDMTTGCGPPSGLRAPFKLKGGKTPGPGDNENICKDKPDGYRAKYDVHEECDTAIKKWVIIDGICRDGDVKNEPACATCDSCGDGDTTRDAKASSLARNECTPRGCEAPPPDDNGGGNGNGNGNGNNSNWCKKSEYNPVTCHVGPIPFSLPCFEASVCRDSTFTCSTFNDYFNSISKNFQSFLPQNLINNIIQSNICSDKSCPSTETRLQCHGTDPTGECYAVSLCTKASKCSDILDQTAQALVKLQDGPCPLAKNDNNDQTGTSGKISGHIIVNNPNSIPYKLVKISICEKGGTKSTCREISAEAPDKNQFTNGQPATNGDEGGTLSWKYTFDVDGNSSPIVTGSDYRIVNIYALETNPRAQDEKIPARIDDADVINCSGWPCGKDFVLSIKTDDDPLSISGTVTVVNATPDRVNVSRCKANSTASPNNPCESDPNAVTGPDGSGLFHFIYYTDGAGITFKTGETYKFLAEARNASRVLGKSDTVSASPGATNVDLKISVGSGSGEAVIDGTVNISGTFSDTKPKISLCDVDAQNQILLPSCKDQTLVDHTGTVYPFTFSNVDPVHKGLVIWRDHNPIDWDACSTIKATCDPSDITSNMDNACIIPVTNDKTYTRKFDLGLNDPKNSIVGNIKIIPQKDGNVYKSDLYTDPHIDVFEGKDTQVSGRNSTVSIDRNKIQISSDTKEINKERSIKYAVCGLDSSKYYAVSTYLLKGNTQTTSTDRQASYCTSSQGGDFATVLPENKRSPQSTDLECILKPKGTSDWIIGIAENDEKLKNVNMASTAQDVERAFKQWIDGEITDEQLSSIIHSAHTFGLQMDTCDPNLGECNI